VTMKSKQSSTPECPIPQVGVGAGEQAATIRVLGCPLPRWARWPVLGAFLFFLIKGLLWLSLPAIVVAWRSWAAG
jgi:hypothetical protein